VLVTFGAQLARFRLFSPLALLGQASLEVFSVHILCCFAGDLLSHQPDPQLSYPTQAVLLIVTIAVLFLTALAARWITERRRASAAAVAPTPAPQPS
jgi:fucose 4-O-acetylase-like acetyltransferase